MANLNPVYYLHVSMMLVLKIYVETNELIKSTLYSIDTHFDTSTTDNFGKHRNEQFLVFPQCFLFNQIIVSQFVHIFDIISLFAAKLEEPKIGI